MPNDQSKQSKLHFVITESQLKDIYNSINHAIGDYTLRTQLLLSKPEISDITPDNVYSDCYILTLSTSDADYLTSVISTNSQSGAGHAASIVRGALTQGRLDRE